MVNYTCPTCSKQFNRKSNYDYHIENKKKPCQPIAPEAPEKLQNNSESSQKAPKNFKKK